MVVSPDGQRSFRLSKEAAAPPGVPDVRSFGAAGPDGRCHGRQQGRTRGTVTRRRSGNRWILCRSGFRGRPALVMMKEVEGLSLKELEKIYKVNENALKVRLFRARQRVLKAFGAAEKEGRGSSGWRFEVKICRCAATRTKSWMPFSGRTAMPARIPKQARISCPPSGRGLSPGRLPVFIPPDGQRLRDSGSGAVDRPWRVSDDSPLSRARPDVHLCGGAGRCRSAR